MHVEISEEAEADLRSIENYLRPLNPFGLERLLGATFGAMYQLETFPLLGKVGRVETTRELAVPRTPLLIVYRIDEPMLVRILRILHGRQQWPPEREER